MAGYRKPVIRKKVSGPSSYSTGGFTVTIGELESVAGAVITVESSTFYHPQIASISGNTIKVIVYAWDGAAVSEISAGTDLSGVTFHILAWSD